MLRTYGKSAALITLLGDLVKAIASAVFGLILMPGDGFAYIAGIACMVGHAFPIYFKFKGGKGVVVALGTMLVLNPSVCGICLLIWILVVSFTKYVSLSSMLAATVFPLVNYFLPFWFMPHPMQTIASVVIAVFIVWLHRENIVRLAKGTENKLGRKKPENIRNKLDSNKTK
jgi:glycerol-3-phosphate acyltransferase PlsY